MTSKDVCFEVKKGVGGDLGIITLNKPAVLNALSTLMVEAIYQQLVTWAAMPSIKAVIIQATPGRAFCAGGDLRALYQHMLADATLALDFFEKEYRLCRYTHHYPKPYIALLNGITMGGGAGISINCSHRIATENMTFAMPETKIGFYPDVGAIFFLPRLKYHFGYYLGMTGNTISVDDCVFSGIVQYKINSNSLLAIQEALANTIFSNDAHKAVDEILAQFQVPSEKTLLQQMISKIDQVFSEHSIEKMIQMLQSQKDSFEDSTKSAFFTNSPLSMAVTLEALKFGSTHIFDECMDKTAALTSTFLNGNDFKEGIRAIIIDKDKKPQWFPQSFSDINQALLNQYIFTGSV